MLLKAALTPSTIGSSPNTPENHKTQRNSYNWAPVALPHEVKKKVMISSYVSEKRLLMAAVPTSDPTARRLTGLGGNGDVP